MYTALICAIYDHLFSKNANAVFELKGKKLFIGPVKLVLAFLIYFPIVFVMGFRYNIGTDYQAYERYFYAIMANREIYTYMETGYNYLNYFVFLFSDNAQMMFLLVSIIICIPFLKSIKNLNGEYFLGALFFMSNGYYIWAMNGQRQFIAITLVFYGFKYLENKNFKNYILLCAIAFLFHRTAIFCVLLYFAINFFKTQTFCAVSFVIGIMVKVFHYALVSVFVNNDFYAGYLNDRQWGSNRFLTSDFSPRSVLIAIIFLIILLVIRRYGKFDERQWDMRWRMAWILLVGFLFFYDFGNGAIRVLYYINTVYILIFSDLFTCLLDKKTKWFRLPAMLPLLAWMIYLIVLADGGRGYYLPFNFRFS